MEHERRPKGGDDDPEPGSPAGTRCSGRIEIHPGGPRRDPDGVTRPGLPPELRRSLGSTNIIESMNGVVRQVSRNVKRWRNASMALRWTFSGMFEAQMGFRRINAYRQLSLLEQALARHRGKAPVDAMEDAA